ncbi:hypothetical protein [Microbulbifer spongiae]|uniref:Right-handed parallel beta-helix repeat-containing protein n=1 Tax=Microbulbifer spongiae TaxID=2944933 RepID=A0ABY9E6P1_9GAMM|nr:hypothetical protein [Microbulbifer sp. MI-G]WKD48683.1 hypothetical protein M8T91_12280 [Microbulbifer sp. MI-G]
MMKKVMASVVLMALVSVSYADTDLDLDAFCNSNGTFQGIVTLNNTNYLRCDLPTSIAVNDTVVLARDSDLAPLFPIVWALPGIVVVGNGHLQNANPSTVDKTVLKIEPGTQIVGAVYSNSALVITRGAQIDARGTPSDPIVFSSIDDDMADTSEWGGLILAGFAESNGCPRANGQDTCEMEGLATPYYYGGGRYLDETMNSGILEYVVIAEGGHEVALESEINGLTLYSVNSSTTINNVHIHNNKDDGIQFFGGDAAVENLWLTCNRDDSVDWEEGFQGSLSNVFIAQGDDADHAFELASGSRIFWPGNRTARGVVTNVTVGFYGSSSGFTDVPLKLTWGTDAYFENIEISGYTQNLCNDTVLAASTNPDRIFAFNNMQYDCTRVIDNTSYMTLPASASATGFSVASFWNAPTPRCE